MKKILLSMLVIGTSALHAQATDPTYIFYQQHENLINPAAVGMEFGHTISVDIRNQWRGMTEAPQTQTLFTTHRLSDRVGLGFSLASNKVFIQKQAGIYADFSYAIPISYNSRLIGGIKFGGDFYNIDGSDMTYYNGLYNQYYPNGTRMHPTYYYDPYLQTISGKFQTNFGAGLYYDHPNFYVGFSTPNMLATDRVRMDNDQMTSLAETMYFYTIAGYYWRLTPDFTIKPRLQMRLAKGEYPSTDITVAGNFLERAELGITYRTDKAVNAYVLFNIPNYYVSIGYGFESYFQTHMNLQSRNSHEFLVQFKW